MSNSFVEVGPAGPAPPFAIERVYFIVAASSSERGFHAHRLLRQMAHCPVGGCTFVLDDGLKRWEVELVDPTRGLLIEPMIWREMRDFSADCVLVVLANAHYDAADYIRDYAEFQRSARAQVGD